MIRKVGAETRRSAERRAKTGTVQGPLNNVAVRRTDLPAVENL